MVRRGKDEKVEDEDVDDMKKEEEAEKMTRRCRMSRWMMRGVGEGVIAGMKRTRTNEEVDVERSR